MKTVRYTASAARDLKRYAVVAQRVRAALAEYAQNRAHSNNVTQLVGSQFHRLRVGDFRAIFDETATEITVLKIGPRGNVYE